MSFLLGKIFRRGGPDSGERLGIILLSGDSGETNLSPPRLVAGKFDYSTKRGGRLLGLAASDKTFAQRELKLGVVLRYGIIIGRRQHGLAGVQLDCPRLGSVAGGYRSLAMPLSPTRVAD